MAGLYGCVRKEGNKTSLDGRLLLHSEKDEISEVNCGGTQIGCVSHNFYENSVIERESYIISFYGEIFEVLNGEKATRNVRVKNANELEALLVSLGEKNESILQILKDVLPLLNGAFIVVLFEKDADRLTILNDRFGLYPFFYAERNGSFYYGQEAKVFKDVLGLEPDYTGIAEYLSFDYCLEDRTLFKNVKYILPSQTITFYNGSLQTEIYWEMPATRGNKEKDKRSYVKSLHDLYEKAVRERSNDDAIIGLTGGFDSRLILGILGGGKKIHTYNFGNMGSGDQVGASALAKAYHTDHHYMDFKQIDYLEDAQQIVWLSDGQCPFERFYVLETARAKSHVSGGVEISGMGGDAISGQKSNFTGIIPIMGMRMNEARKNNIGRKIFVAAQRNRIAACNGRYYGECITSRWNELQIDYQNALKEADKALTFGNYTMRLKMRSLERRVTMSSMWLTGQFLPIRFPIYDYRIVDFFNSVPQTYRFGQRLYLRMIQDYYPKAAKCPHSETGKPVREFHAVFVDFVTVSIFLRAKLGLKRNSYNNSFGFVNDKLVNNLENGNIQPLLFRQRISENGIINLDAFDGSIDGLIKTAIKGNGTAMIALKSAIHFSLMNELFYEGKMNVFCRHSAGDHI